MRNHYCFMPLLFATACAALPAAYAQERQQEVARRAAQVMPFALSATTHVFTKSGNGGVQRVIAKSDTDDAQIRMVRDHLRTIAAQFTRGDYSGPTRIHGARMPGLAQLQAAPPGRVAMEYRDVPAGAEITYATADPALVGALHRWFDAQLADHGHDAVSGNHPASHRH